MKFKDLGDIPTYPFGVNDDYFKRLNPDKFEKFATKQPFDIVVGNWGEVDFSIIAEMTILANSGYDAIKIAAKLCPDSVFMFGKRHFEDVDLRKVIFTQRTVMEALWGITEYLDGADLTTDVECVLTEYLNADILDSFITAITEVEDE